MPLKFDNITVLKEMFVSFRKGRRRIKIYVFVWILQNFKKVTIYRQTSEEY